MKIRSIVSAAAVLFFANILQAETPAPAPWKPQRAALMTPWASQVSPDNALREYPRPQLERPEWVNLNGLWDYAIVPSDQTNFPKKYQGRILVPFPVESALSGVMKSVGAKNRVFYTRTFRLPESWKGRKILLNFGAVDWDCTVFINNKKVGSHTGGYDAFTFDITQSLSDGFNTVTVNVWDPSNEGTQPLGKQHAKPQGSRYTSTSGIWQTVWVEAVPQSYVKSLKITPDIDSGEVEVLVDGVKDVRVSAFDGDREVASAASADGRVTFKIDNAKLWSPESPFLYNLTVRAGSDEVSSYFGMRKIALDKDAAGITRIFLNNQPYFQHGPLDQGYWPDGLYTAPTDAALRSDIDAAKKLGFNMARKHMKIEPDRWYYWCDKLGLLVWQDMPGGDRPIGAGKGEVTRSKASADNFERELAAMVNSHYNHPSIVMWVPFSEGFGQYKTVKITNYVKQLDPTRLVNSASGWNDYGSGDVRDVHVYPGPGAPSAEENRAAVLGEYGGLGFAAAEHLWKQKGNRAQRFYSERDDLTAAYEMLTHQLRLLNVGGLSAAVYTQLTDVEQELNGLLTYDRAMVKPNEDRLASVHQKLNTPAPKIITLIPIAREASVDWRYTVEKPADNWTDPAFNDTWWNTDTAGFGSEGAPEGLVRTKWETPEIWMRKNFNLAVTAFNEPHFVIHHDEDVEIFINGQLVFTASGGTNDYVAIPLNDKAKAALKSGVNNFAVHCKQTKGGQYVDLGLIDLIEQK